MKISRIEIYTAELPYAGGSYALSGGRVYTSFGATYARVITDTGLDGWGESTPFGATYIAADAMSVRSGLQQIAPALLGMDPRAHDAIYDRMDAVMTGQRHVKTALDVACWDVAGKAAGLPVYMLLGGLRSPHIPLISSIPTDTPEAMRLHVQSMREAGFSGHSIKIGASMTEGGPAMDAARITACLEDRRDGEWFLADANGGMQPEGLMRLFNLLPSGLDFVLEAPCASWAETARLRPHCPYPLLLDELIQSEADLIQAISHNLADGVGLKISKQGGLTPSRRQRDIASAAGMVISVQETVGSEIAFAALLHMAAATPNHLLRCALDTRSMVSASVARFDAPIRDGGTCPPELPGLGIETDREALGAPVAVFEER